MDNNSENSVKESAQSIVLGKFNGFVRKNALYLVLACVGILLLGIPSLGGENKGGSIDSYREYTERRIAELCSQVQGIRGVSVLVTFEDELMTSGNSNAKVCGIAVVCHGSDSKTRLEITELLSAAYSLPANKIYITEGG